MPIKTILQQDVFQFILQTHLVEKIPCTISDIMGTAQKTKKHPHALGHLLAFTYLTSLIDKQDFPVRDATQLNNKFRSEQAAFWIKETHIKMLAPILDDPTNEIDGNGVTRGRLGVYRTTPADNTLCQAPPPQLIPAIMRNWLLELGTIHNKIKTNLDNPYGISKETYNEMKTTTDDIPLFFTTVQPFLQANNRLGRLISQALKLAWRLKTEWNVTNQYDKFKENLGEYQANKLPTITQNARNLKF